MRRMIILLGLTATALLLAVGYASGDRTSVKAVNYDFKPKKVTIEVGDKVAWKNIAGSHTVTFRKGSFDKSISGDDKVSRKFKRAGTFRYYCRPHESRGMKGKVVVE